MALAEWKKTDDPRPPIDKARRKHLERFAEANKIVEVVPGMPADLMRKIIKLKGMDRHFAPWASQNGVIFTRLGSNKKLQEPPAALDSKHSEQPASSVDATDDLMRQWMEQVKQPVRIEEKKELAQLNPTLVEKMSIGQLRQECGKRGIAMKRTDNMKILRDKLRGKDAG